MSNGSISPVKTGATSQIQQPQNPVASQETKTKEPPVEQKSAPLSEEGKASLKTLHQLDGAAKEVALKSSMTPENKTMKSNPLANPTKDGRQDWVRKMIKDGKVESSEARDIVNLAKDDAKLKPNESDRAKLEPAIINLYVRSGVPVDEARKLAGKTIDLSADAKGSALNVSTEKPKEKMTPGKADSIRTEAEDGTKQNAAADKKWTVDQIQKDRAGFMRNVVQIDGDKGTKADFKACAPTSLMGGIILSKPEAAQDLAKKIQSPAGVKEFPELQKEPAKSAVSRMASGNFSPRDVSIVSNGLYASSRYTKDGQLSEGVSTANQMALLGKMKQIGFTPPPMRQDTYGTLDRQGTHVTSFANNTGYDPWPYPGSNGQSTISDGDTAAKNQGLAMGPRLGMHDQKRALLERMQQDGQGGIILERHVVDGKAVDPPLKAKYTFNSAENRWERDPSSKVPSGQEEDMPQYIPVDVEKRRNMKLENQ